MVLLDFKDLMFPFPPEKDPFSKLALDTVHLHVYKL